MLKVTPSHYPLVRRKLCCMSPKDQQWKMPPVHGEATQPKIHGLLRLGGKCQICSKARHLHLKSYAILRRIHHVLRSTRRARRRLKTTVATASAPHPCTTPSQECRDEGVHRLPCRVQRWQNQDIDVSKAPRDHK